MVKWYRVTDNMRRQRKSIAIGATDRTDATTQGFLYLKTNGVHVTPLNKKPKDMARDKKNSST